MASYSLRVSRSAERELRGIPKPDLERILKRIRALADDPRPHGCVRLSGAPGYRVRQGDWRVIYEVDDLVRAVKIIKVGHRREVYR